MGVSSTTNRKPWTGDGTTTTFSFPYYFFNTTDLVVYLFDPTTGNITPQILNTDYSVSGTANAQGIYPNGANVVFGTAPASGIIVIVIRVPPQVQDYSLLQNQKISSTALVQQLDYLTLLVQRMQDQITRAAVLPDGYGSAFTPTLPNLMTLNPGAFLVVNNAGDGFDLSLAGSVNWNGVSIPYTSFSTAGTSFAYTGFTLPAGYVLSGLIIKHSVAFAGTSITAVTANIGITGDDAKFVNAFDVYQTVSDTAFVYNVPFYLASWANTKNIIITLNSVGGNLNALTAGNIDLYYRLEKAGVTL